MKIHFSLWLIFLIALTSYGQTVKLSGRVIDAKSAPIAYASIGLRKAATGTASNEQGFFQLFNHLGGEEDTLTVSCIGYKNYSIALTDIDNLSDVTIILEEFTKTIRGVTIKASDQNAYRIVEKALTNYKNNYTNKKYQLKGFYRQLMRNDSIYVMITEGAFTMEDKGYRKNDGKRLRLDALRKTDDFRNMDSLDILYDTLMESNDLKRMFDLDFIDATSTQWSFYFWPKFSQKILENFEFLLDRITRYNGYEVYEISFFPKRKLKTYNNDYRMFIRRNNYALIEMRLLSKPSEVTSSTDLKRGNVGRLIDGTYSSKRIIQYQEYKGKWFPKYMSSHSTVVGGDKQKSSRMAYEAARERGDGQLIYTDHKINGRTIDPDKNNYFQFRELLITDIKDRKDKFKRISSKELMNPKKYVRNHKVTFDPEFWKKYNTIPMNPYLQKAQEHLKGSDQYRKQF